MIKMDETEVIGFENGRVKMDGRCRIRLPRSGFVHLARTSGYQLDLKPLISLTIQIFETAHKWISKAGS